MLCLMSHLISVLVLSMVNIGVKECTIILKLETIDVYIYSYTYRLRMV